MLCSIDKKDGQVILKILGIRILLHSNKKNKFPDSSCQCGRTFSDGDCLDTKVDELLLFKDLQFFIEKAGNKKRVLIVTCEFEFNGASLCIFPVIDFLKNHNISCAVLSYKDGPLRKKFIESGVDTFVIPDLYARFKEFSQLVSRFDFIFCNTIATFDAAYFADKLHTKYLWWCHEAGLIETIPRLKERRYGFPNLYDVLRSGVKIYTVSDYSKSILSKYTDNVGVLRYGIPDTATLTCETKRNNRVVFTTLGVEYRKGTDVLIEAVKSLPESYQDRFLLNIVGGTNSSFAQELIADTSSYTNIRWCGYIEGDAKHKILCQSDVVVAVSRDDPLPIAVTEGFMYSKPCLISRTVGQKDIINNNVEGYVVSCEDVHILSCQIAKIIDHSEVLPLAGRKARKIYELYFTMNKFEASLTQLFGALL